MAALLMMHWPILASGFRLTQVEVGDSRLINYLLEHCFRLVTGTAGVDSLWEMPIFWPHPNVGAYTDTLIAVSPPYMLGRWLGAPPDTAFQVWLLSMTALNFAVFHWFARTSLQARPAAAAFGALLYAAGASRCNLLGHPQLLCGVYLILVAAALERLFRAGPRSATRDRWWIAALGGAGVAQCYAGFYFAFFLAIGLGLAVIVGATSRPLRQRAMELLRERKLSLALVAVAASALLLHAYLHFKASADESGYHDWNYVTTMLPRVQSWVYMSQRSLLYGWYGDFEPFRTIPNKFEHEIGIGWLTPLLAATGLLLLWRRPGLRVLAIVTALGIALPTYYDGWSAWRTIFDHLPAAGAVRAVTRIGMVLLLPAAIGFTLFMARPRWRLRSLLVLGLICTAEQITTPRSYDKLAMRRVIASLAEQVPADAPAFYLTTHGITTSSIKTNIDAMWASIATGIPTVNGYSGKTPPRFEPLDQVGHRDDLHNAKVEAELTRWANEHDTDRRQIHWVQYQAKDRAALYDHTSEITSVDLPDDFSIERKFVARVEAKNAGRGSWQASGRDRVLLGGRLFQGNTVIREFRGSLPHDVSPGESASGDLPINFDGLQPGTFTLRISLLCEDRYWFEDLGSTAFAQTLEIHR